MGAVITRSRNGGLKKSESLMQARTRKRSNNCREKTSGRGGLGRESAQLTKTPGRAPRKNKGVRTDFSLARTGKALYRATRLNQTLSAK